MPPLSEPQQSHRFCSSRIDDLKRDHPELSLAEITVEAGGQRFRAILLTTLTISVGLIPLLAENSVQAQFPKPMAVSVGIGVMFATGITLVLLPMILLIANDFKRCLLCFGNRVRHSLSRNESFTKQAIEL